MGKTSNRYYWTKDQKNEMVSLYENEKYSIQDIADKFSVNRETIRYHLLKRKVEMRTTGFSTERAKNKQRGKNHHNWKGGRYKHATGYYLKLLPEHPNSKRGYISEHRYVMEKFLKENDPEHIALDKNGFLKKNWVVHHKNGVKHDNSIKNLEPLPRNKHHSWLHYQEEMKRLKDILDNNNISY